MNAIDERSAWAQKNLEKKQTILLLLKIEIEIWDLFFDLILKKKNEKNSEFYFILKQKSNVPCDPRIKLEVSFSFFILILKTKNHIYLNKYLIKLVSISPHTVIINKCKRINYFYWSSIKFLQIKLQTQWIFSISLQNIFYMFKFVKKYARAMRLM